LRIVLDTNVLVSGLLSESGPPGRLVSLITEDLFVPYFDARILAEYREVLLRPHLAIAPVRVEQLLTDLEEEGVFVVGHPLPERLPDSDDEPFLEVAVTAGAEFLVTGNLRHFLARLRQGVAVVSPRAFLDALRRPSTG
jgi:putative PIN family toxin of toxin-antitoxin system